MMRFVLAATILASAACSSPGPGRATMRELDSIANNYARQEARAAANAPAQAPEEDPCRAASYGERIGTPVADMDVPPGARVIGPNTAVTQDFRPDRLNIIVDETGAITAFRCY